MEIGLVALITADPGVQACPTQARLAPLVFPENGPKPASTYQRISTRGTESLDGPVDVTTARLQFDHWGARWMDVRAAGDAYDALLDGFSGTLPDGTVVFSIVLDSSKDLYEQESRLYRVSSDYLITFAR